MKDAQWKEFKYLVEEIELRRRLNYGKDSFKVRECYQTSMPDFTHCIRVGRVPAALHFLILLPLLFQ